MWSDSHPQIYSTYVLLTQIAGQQLHVEAGLLLCAAGQELIPLAGKHSLPPLIATSFWSFVAKLFIVCIQNECTVNSFAINDQKLYDTSVLCHQIWYWNSSQVHMAISQL